MQKMTDRTVLKGSLLVSSVFTHTHTVSEHPRLSCVWCCNDHVGIVQQWVTSYRCVVCLCSGCQCTVPYTPLCVSSFKVVDTRYGHISYCKFMVTFRKVCIRSHNVHVMAQTCTLGPQWVRDGRGQWYALSAGCNQTWWSSQVTRGTVLASDRIETPPQTQAICGPSVALAWLLILWLSTVAMYFISCMCPQQVKQGDYPLPPLRCLWVGVSVVVL